MWKPRDFIFVPLTLVVAGGGLFWGGRNTYRTLRIWSPEEISCADYLAHPPAKDWVRLRVADFHAATKLLRDDKLIVDERDGEFVALAPDTGTDRVVRRLVEQGMAVYEIARHKQTLEDFYLELMRNEPAVETLNR